MKIQSLFFVFLGCSAAMLSGCAIHRVPGGVSMSGILGSNVTAGYTDRAEVLVHNQYPYLTMEASLRVVTYPAWAFRGDGNDPLLGTRARPTFARLSRLRASVVPGQDVKVSPDRIVLPQEDVAVIVAWYDHSGRCVGTATRAFQTNSDGYYQWHLEITPYIGQIGLTRWGDPVPY